MKTNSRAQFLRALVLTALCFSTTESWARLPKPIQAMAAVLAVDVESETLVVKFTLRGKPVLLEWNKDTVFSRSGAIVTATALKQGVSAVIHYKRVSFHNPLVKMVIWDDKADAK